ncbi:IclR family transcriptional regulator [Pseudonocardia ailaonensis]|uniref:IclR family transcriptional regulator n=1 Tax=Pseudonocardia ailaonensis TaxID=367279 RepID=A0ABN2NPN1_9PSEU
MLSAFTAERTTMTATEIAAVIEVSVPTAHRIAKALEGNGYLARHGAGKAYGPGPQILRLARLMSETRVNGHQGALLAALRDRFDETVSLHIRVGDRRVCIAEEVSRQGIRVTSGVGETYPLTAGAAGKAILAQLPADEVHRIVDLPASDAWGLPRTELLEEIELTRRRGWATSTGETVPGALAVAVPLPLSGDGPPSALNLVGPRDRMDPDTVDKALAALREAARS